MGVVCRAMYWSYWSYGVMVSTLDFESSDPGSNPGRTSFLRQSGDCSDAKWKRRAV